MSGVNTTLDIAKMALFLNQQAIDVTSHNIANVNTPGFSRQRLVVEVQDPQKVREGMLGRGVIGGVIERFSDKYIVQRLIEKQSNLADWEARQLNLERLETMFNETGENGLTEILSEFFSSWQDLANHPDGVPQREALLSRGDQLAARLSEFMSDLDKITQDLNLYIGAAVTKINQLTAEIAELNDRILANENTGRPANDFRDQREVTLAELNKLISIDYFETANGEVTVFTGRGKLLVESKRSWDLFMQGDTLYYQPDYNPAVPTMGVIDRNDLHGGQIKAWMEIRYDTLPDNQGNYTTIYDLKNDLDALAKALIWEMNDQHSQGVGLTGLTTVTGTTTITDQNVRMASSSSGIDFYDKLVEGQSFKLFVYDASGNPTEHGVTLTANMTATQFVSAINDTGSHISASLDGQGRLSLASDSGYSFGFAEDDTNVLAALGINTFFSWISGTASTVGNYASSISVNTNLFSDSRLIAAGRINLDDGTFQAGNNQTALDLADVKDKLVLGGTPPSQTLFGFLDGFVSNLGVQVDRARTTASFAAQTTEQMMDLRDNISAVSLDEEMVNIIKFQKAYQMSAMMIRTADEMLQTVLNIKA